MIPVVQTNTDDGNTCYWDGSKKLSAADKVSLNPVETVPLAGLWCWPTLSTVTWEPPEPDSRLSTLENPCTVNPAAGSVSSGSAAQYSLASDARNRMRLSHAAILPVCVRIYVLVVEVT